MDKIGRYEILKSLGQGAFSTVFLAVDTTLDRQVALKYYDGFPQKDDARMQSFVARLRTLAVSDHLALVPIYHFDFADNGYFYVVMQYMAGGSLSDRLEQGAIEWSEAVAITTRIASALEALHRDGVFLGSFTPTDILFDADNKAFLSTISFAESEIRLSLENTGEQAIDYISLERAQGLKLQPESDVYVLGLHFYRMIVGELPYSQEPPMARLMKLLHEPIPRPTEYKPDLPIISDLIIAKTLDQDPRKRYQSAWQLQQQLPTITYTYQDVTKVYQECVLDVAMAQEVIVEQLAELVAMVRQTASGGLRAVLEIDTSYRAEPEEVQSKPFRMEFPVDSAGQTQAGNLMLRVDAPDFTPPSQEKTILIPPSGDSEPVIFLLTPQRVGELVINLELYKQKVHIAQRLLRVNGKASGTAIQSGEQSVVSIPLSVFSTLPASQQALLLDLLVTYFNLSELNGLCFELGVDFEILEGQEKRGKAQALLQYIARHGRLAELMTAIERARPNLDLKLETIAVPHAANSPLETKDVPTTVDSPTTGSFDPLPLEPPTETYRKSGNLPVLLLVTLAILILLIFWYFFFFR